MGGVGRRTSGWGLCPLPTKVVAMRSHLARKIALLGLVGCMLFGWNGCALLGVVYIPDAGLESAIRASLRKPFGFLTRQDLLRVTEIQAAGLGIRTLQGIEHCRSLLTLDLRSNQIQSITPLAGLGNLRWLDLSQNRITNISPLSGLFLLEWLDLHGPDNDIRDWGALVANAQNGGIGAGTTLTLSPEWTIQSDGTFYDDFQEVYQILVDAGVKIIFAESSGT